MNHIPPSVNKTTITSMFEKYGQCVVHMKQQLTVGAKEKHAFVNYSSLVDAQNAVSGLDGTTLNGVKISVIVQSECKQSSSLTGTYTVKVENLSKSITEKSLEEIFSFYGDVELASTKMNSPASSPFSYAYVNYCSEDDAQRAVDELNGIKIDGSCVKVKTHRPQSACSPISPFSPNSLSKYGRSAIPSPTSLPCGRPALPCEPLTNQRQPVSNPVYPEEPPSKTVKVTIQGNLTSDDLEAIFNPFGTITAKPNVIPGSPNYAFINFSSPHEAVAALGLNRQLIKGVRVGVKLKKGPGAPVVTASSHDYHRIDCEPLLVQMITLSAQSEYKLQIIGIESSLQVKVMPMKSGNGFTISGNEDKLQQAKSDLELVISRAQEKLGEDPFLLHCQFAPIFTNQEVVKKITKIEEKYHVEFLVYNDTDQDSVSVSIFSHFVSTQLKSHTDAPAKIDCVSKYLATSTTGSAETEQQTGGGGNIVRRPSPSISSCMINLRVRGLKENLENAIKDFRKELQSSVTKKSIPLPPDSEGTFHSSLLKLSNLYLVSASVCDDTIHIEGAQGYIGNVVIMVREEKLSFERKCLAESPSGMSTRPDNWGPQDEEISLVSVARGTPEWTDVEKLVHASLPLARIQTLQRIQNEWLWDKYRFSKERMSNQNNGVVNEKRLFHGTRSTAPEKIFKSRQGFDFRFCSRGMWGNGTYFAVNAKYSDDYAYRSSGAKQLILAKVLTGETYRCAPDQSLTKPPVRKQSKMFVDELYDSVSGHTNGSNIFIIYDHEKAYPEYLITYTTTTSF